MQQYFENFSSLLETKIEKRPKGEEDLRASTFQKYFLYIRMYLDSPRGSFAASAHRYSKHEWADSRLHL